MGRVSWSDLPKELLVFIAKLLDTDMDFLRFRSICTSWRSSVPLHHKNSLHLPLQLPVWISPNDRNNASLPGFFTLTESTTYQLEPVNKNSNWSTIKAASSSSSKSTGWLMKVEEAKPGKMRLLNLLSKCPIQHLPETFPKVLNLLDFRILEISKAYSINYVDPEHRPVIMYGDSYSLFANKVVLSSNLGDYAILALHSGGKLGFLKAGDEKWTTLDDRSRFEDIINYRGQLCAIDNTGRAISIDFSSKLSEIASPICGRGGGKKHLVESLGDLLLVNRYQENRQQVFYYQNSEGFGRRETCPFIVTLKFKVFKLNKQQQEWVETKSLGDQVLFVGDDGSFSVSARDFGGCKGNCIYYKEEYFAKYNESDYTLTGLSCHGIGDDDSFGPLASYPGYSSIFWPPPGPTWQQRNSCSAE